LAFLHRSALRGLGLKNGTTRHKARRGCGIYLEFELEYPYLYADKYNFRQIISSLNTGTDALLLTGLTGLTATVFFKRAPLSIDLLYGTRLPWLVLLNHCV
jgi:hypothetical protein